LNDQEFVRAISKKVGINFYTKNINVLSEKRKDESTEEAARRIRYKYLLETLDNIEYDKVATGHTLDDNVETIIFRLISGTGVNGGIGIHPKNGYIIHPLLGISKDQILNFLKHESIEYRSDITNYDKKIVRNKIRHDVIPLLKSINRNSKEHIVNFSKILNEEDKIINKLTSHAFQRILVEYEKEEIKIDFNKFKKLDAPIRVRILIKIYKQLTRNSFKDHYISYNIIKYLSRCNITGNKLLYYNDLITIYKEYNFIVFKKKVVSITNKGYLHYVNSTDVTINIQAIKRKILFYKKDIISKFESNKLYFDLKKIVFPLIIRSREKGDRIRLKNVGFKKIKNIFIDEKVQTSFYGKMNRVSEEYMINSDTKKVLVCELV